MKVTRLSLLLLSLVLTVLVAPEAFGAKRGHGGALRPSKTPTASAYECFDIYCYGYLSGFCCGTVEECLGECDGVCNVTPGTCIYVQ